MLKRVGTAGMIAALGVTMLGGCTEPTPRDELRETIDLLLEHAGPLEIGRVTISDREVTLSVLDGEAPTTHRLVGVDGEIDTAQSDAVPLYDYRPADEIAVDGLLDRVDAARSACLEADPDGYVTASLTVAMSGAVLETVACQKAGGDGPDQATAWIDGTEVETRFDDWSSARAMQAVIDQSIALVGPSLELLSFAGPGREDSQAIAEAALVPAGYRCEQHLDWGLLATEPAQWYDTCADGHEGTPGPFDASGLTATAVLDAVGADRLEGAVAIRVSTTAADGRPHAWVEYDGERSEGPFPID